MFILGFESTAHTFGASVVESQIEMEKKGVVKKGKKQPLNVNNTKILSEIDMKYPALMEGFIPRKLADFHAKNFDSILSGALDKAGVAIRDLDAVCYSYGPGIGHSLHIGYVASKTISVSQKIPQIPVNHALAHIEIARFQPGLSDPLGIYVSGGNTQILVLEKAPGGLMRYRVLGETMDIGLGNFLDQLGRRLELDPPDAIGVLKMAAKGKNLLDLPYLVKGMSTSFSGMLTASIKIDRKKNTLEDLCYSAQENAFSMLLEASERGLTLSKKKAIVGVGGNYRNKRLQEMTTELAKEHDIPIYFPPFEHLGDNAGMITLTGALQFASGVYSKNTHPNQKARIDAELVGW